MQINNQSNISTQIVEINKFNKKEKIEEKEPSRLDSLKKEIESGSYKINLSKLSEKLADTLI